MATVIQTGENSFIAGDPPQTLGPRKHWCPSCGGDGLEYDWNDDLGICFGCMGACVVDCTDEQCPEHASQPDGSR